MEAEEVLGPSRPRSKSKGKKRERERETSPVAGPSTPGTPTSQASQDDEGEEPADEHYNGLVGAGEYVMLRRQPQNPYDSNAVQVGHVPRNTAARIAPLMDARLITVEGRMIGQNLDGKHRFKLPIQRLPADSRDMCVYCRPAHRPHLEPEFEWITPMGQSFDMLRRKGQDPNQSAFYDYGTRGGQASNSNDKQVEKLLKGLKQVSADEKAADDVMLPLLESPPGVASGELNVDLLPHQSQAIRWMIDHEHPKLPKIGEPAVQFWSKQKGKGKNSGYWLNAATKTPQEADPELGRGGIIADGMGLGKTLSTLGLVLATMDEEPICPLSVLSNWQKQIEDHVAPGKLTYYTYHGAGAKGVKGKDLVEYDAGIATPVKGSKQAKSSTKKGPLMKVHWKRVVADEGHILKNPKAKSKFEWPSRTNSPPVTKAFANLQAERRWIATGTPIVNSPTDLGTLLACTRVCTPLDKPEFFKSLVLRPLRSGSAEAGRLLQGIVGQVLLRRTKDTVDAEGRKIVELPPIEFYQCEVQLDPETRKTYDEVLEISRQRFEESLRTGEVSFPVAKSNSRCALTFSPIRASRTADIPVSSSQSVLQLTSVCLLCISEVIKRQGLCPMDRHELSMASLLELPPDLDLVPDDVTVKPAARSAKIAELVKYLRAFDAGDKTLVFSQFTSFLDRVAGVLEDEEISYCRFDGSMPAAKTQDKDSPHVMLISLKSGAVGLNLTAASNVFLSAIEAQAIDRVHRRKTVRVFQLIAADTVEAKVLDIQKRKDALVAKKSGTKADAATKKKARFEDLKEIFGVK
ncbi:hypothetical protein A1Q1_06427 [Trichosporon asahii var. asahii CBS 2479]|uniref:Helicase ATP-binding domain-containing protein n=1 Tax=Trichosporon asahii var. asahii (strain ATCC 90039 / CBS 2479 / JCM 2466 / KCTC 7840 / NBRC 103889/ NCYC 2677 / UAMH 7654) TaxID=1186058 RepID=J4U5E5_TRIAS|nr:hypothetical protein A1Q1_06427 [Trichosporon asahii var. asahii CBS 2479]EJT45195.1 hypothetical protein A1Q1_06427 [Trichosporon asahii var. asahii CBS 2479]